MSEIITLNKFDTAVEEYQRKEREVKEHFILGIITLGKILKKQRDTWKPKELWTKYLYAIGKSMAGANQFIRLYEYSEKHQKELLTSGMTNWNQINNFLSLPDNLKEELLKYGENLEDFDNEEFKNKVQEIKEEIPEDFSEQYEKIVKEVDNTLASQSIKKGIQLKAEELLKKLVKKGSILTSNSIAIARATIALRIALSEFSTVDFSLLSKAEQKVWLDEIKRLKLKR